MILIFSSNTDISTTMIVEWLIRYKKNYTQINGDDENTLFNYYDIDNNKLIVTQHNKQINLLDATSIWYRRRGFSLKSLPLNRKHYFQQVIHDIPRYHVHHNEREFRSLIDFIFYVLQDRKGKTKILGNYFQSSVNKLQLLDMAKKYGLQIPQSHVITTRTALETLRKKSGGIITKALSDGVYLLTPRHGYYSYTEKITPKILKTIPRSFFPSLVQSEIRKKYELRVFCLNDQLYSMAIFSQKSKGTQVDFRKAMPDSLPRSVPYNLPTHIGKILKKIMKDLDLNTGSFDLIVDTNDNYIFLEVNPVGQFSMTSIPCNYYLEKKIAEIL